MSLHYLGWGNMNPGNCISLKHCILLKNQKQKHILIITWLSLNHPSLSLGYVSNSVNASCRHFFLSATLRISAWCRQHSSATAMQNSQISPKLWPQQAKAENSNDYITKFNEPYSSENTSCKSAIIKKSSSLWLNSGKPLTLT